jgi:hypothetical protein
VSRLVAKSLSPADYPAHFDMIAQHKKGNGGKLTFILAPRSYRKQRQFHRTARFPQREIVGMSAAQFCPYWQS